MFAPACALSTAQERPKTAAGGEGKRRLTHAADPQHLTISPTIVSARCHERVAW